MLGFLGIAFAGAGTLDAGAQGPSESWRFSTQPFADLWFHGMALADPIGPGPNPLYDPGYPAEVRKLRANAGLTVGASATRFTTFREAFRRDPALEVMHFVPLYFPQAERTEALSALEILAGTVEGLPPSPTARTAFGVAAVGSVLTTPGQRKVLGEYVRALREEWEEYYGVWWRNTLPERETLHASAQLAWEATLGPSLEPSLRARNLSGGIVALVPSMGIEGRIFGGSPRNPGDNVLMVSLPSGPDGNQEVAFTILRELSFPLVRQVMNRVEGGEGDRNEEEGVAGRAAIRSGALMLQRYRPDDVHAYQQFFLSRAGIPVPSGSSAHTAFEEAFPLNPRLAEALGEEILTRTTLGGSE